MTLRQKAFAVTFFVPIAFIVNLLLAMYIDKRFVWLAFLLPVGAWIYSFRLRCKDCGTLMAMSSKTSKRKILFWGMEFTYWGGWWGNIPKSCSRCGAKF